MGEEDELDNGTRLDEAAEDSGGLAEGKGKGEETGEEELRAETTK